MISKQFLLKIVQSKLFGKVLKEWKILCQIYRQIRKSFASNIQIRAWEISKKGL